MKVELKKFVTTRDGVCHVLVSSGAGLATLPLRTPANQVVPGASCTAELDVEVPLVAGNNAQPTTERVYHINSDGEVVTLVGVVDGIDPDGLVYFRLGPDALVMIEAELRQFLPGDWLRVEVPVNRIGISLSF